MKPQGTTTAICDRVLNTMPLSEFFEVYNSDRYLRFDFEQLKPYASEYGGIESIPILFTGLPDAKTRLHLLLSKEYNHIWLTVYPVFCGTIGVKSIVEIYKTCVALISAYTIFLRVHIALSTIDDGYNANAAREIEQITGVAVQKDNVLQALPRIAAIMEMYLNEYNAHTVDYLHTKPTISKQMFINVIKDTCDAVNIWPAGTTPETIFESITVSEWLQYFQCRKEMQDQSI